MALNPETTFVGKITASSASYPYGEARNITSPGDATGTPFLAPLVNDQFGYQQGILTFAGVVPSNSPDTAIASQYMQAAFRSHGMVRDDYTALKAVDSTVLSDGTSCLITRDGLQGFFTLDLADVVSADDNGVVIVATDGARWVRHINTVGVNLRWYDAKGDDATDDTTAIDNWSGYCKNNERRGYAPAGVYRMDKTASSPAFGIYINSKVELFGDGEEKTIFKNMSATAAGFRCATGNISIHDFTIDQNGSTGNGFQQGGQYSVTYNLTVRSMTGAGIALVVDGSTNATIRDVTIADASNGIDVGATTPTNYVNFTNVRVEPTTGTALKSNLASNVKFDHLYMEPSNSAGNISRFIDMTGSSQVDFISFGAELGGTHVLTDAAYFQLNNDASVNFSGARINHDGTAAKTIFQLVGTTTSNISFSDVEIISTKTSMTLFDFNGGATLVNHSIKRVKTVLTSAANGVVCSNTVNNLVIENWVDTNAASSHTVNAVNLQMINVPGAIATTQQDNQTYINCPGAISGTGSETGVKIKSNSRAVDMGSTNDAPVCFAYADNASYTDQVYFSKVNRASGTGFNHFLASTTSGTVAFMQGNGDWQNVNGVYGTISDSKYKIDITKATPKLADLMRLEVVNFENVLSPGLKQIGVIAQALQQVWPGLVEENDVLKEQDVTVTKDSTVPVYSKGVATGETQVVQRDVTERMLRPTGEKYLSVKQTVFIPILIKAVQELTARVIALESDNAAK